MNSRSYSARTASSAGIWSIAGGRDGWPVHPVGRAAGDFTDAAVVNAAFASAPRSGRILHTITKQRTGAVQYDIQGELLAENSRIHLNVLEAWRRYQPEAKLISLGSSCTYPEAPHPLDESQFGIGSPHPSVRGYAQAKKTLVVGSETFGSQYGLHWMHCVLATLFGPGPMWRTSAAISWPR